MSSKYNLNVEQGATLRKLISFRDAANTNLFDTAVSAEGQVRSDPSSNTILGTFTCSFTGDKNLIIELDADTTQGFTFPSASYDIKVNWPDEERFILYGTMKIRQTVTR